ncbi:uncharacterized protein CHAB577_0165 [Chlamydia abortus]|nr:uncharacterized protein CHAB577_0165 [Chlamydia abortus]
MLDAEGCACRLLMVERLIQHMEMKNQKKKKSFSYLLL